MQYLAISQTMLYVHWVIQKAGGTCGGVEINEVAAAVEEKFPKLRTAEDALGRPCWLCKDEKEAREVQDFLLVIIQG